MSTFAPYCFRVTTYSNQVKNTTIAYIKMFKKNIQYRLAKQTFTSVLFPGEKCILQNEQRNMKKGRDRYKKDLLIWYISFQFPVLLSRLRLFLCHNTRCGSSSQDFNTFLLEVVRRTFLAVIISFQYIIFGAVLLISVQKTRAADTCKLF